MISFFDIDNWKEISTTLARNKTRTFLTAFGIFWGTTMLTLLWGGGQGFQRMLRMNFEGFASNSAILVPNRTTMPYKGYKKGMVWNLTTSDVENIRRLIPELDIVSPMVSRSATIKYSDRSKSGPIQCLEPNIMQVLNPIILSGRFINETDISRGDKVCVLGENVAKALFGNDSPLGQFVEADNVFYRVVGTIKQRNEMTLNGRFENSMVIPLSTGQRTYNIGNKVNMLAMVAKYGHTPSEVQDKIFRTIRINHPLNPNDKDSFFFMDVSEIFEQIDNVLTGVDILLLFVGMSSLIAGIIGVGNIMWIVVKERTKEFGIRRALGAKPRTIMLQILSESALLTLVAGMAGICFTVLILGVATPIIDQSSGMDVDFQLSFNGAITTMALFLILGGLAGAIPAVKAMKIKPIEALNDK